MVTNRVEPHDLIPKIPRTQIVYILRIIYIIPEY